MTIINHNLDVNQVPFAVVVPELDKAIHTISVNDWSDYAIHVDLRYGCVSPPFSIDTQGKDTCTAGTDVSQDNKRVFIGTRNLQVPEPGSLFLLSVGLLALAVRQRNYRR